MSFEKLTLRPKQEAETGMDASRKRYLINELRNAAAAARGDFWVHLLIG